MSRKKSYIYYPELESEWSHLLLQSFSDTVGWHSDYMRWHTNKGVVGKDYVFSDSTRRGQPSKSQSR